MAFIDYNAQRNILVMSGGHPYDRQAFLGVFDDMQGVQASVVEQPACLAFYDPELACQFDAFVLYDMPGMDFFTPAADDGLAPNYIEPPSAFKQNFLALLERGHGFVFLHHAIAAWPAWPRYAEIVGGQFLYKPGTVRDHAFPDSGYRHDITHDITVLADHPVTEGVDSPFTISDELYLGHVFEDSVTPLLCSNYPYREDNFYSAQHAVQGTLFSREHWQHPPACNLVGWAKHYGNSPIVYLQCGDSEAAYNNPMYRRLLNNAIEWVASDAAKAWAREQDAG